MYAHLADYDLIGHGYQGPVEDPAVRQLPDVDRRLGGDAVPFLRDRGQQFRERTAVALGRRANRERRR